MHVWPSRVDRPDRPDYVIFDLDPAHVAFCDVARVALLLRDALEALELDSIVRTTGGAGLHVVVPIARRHTHEQAREFSEIIAHALARTTGGLVTTERSLSRRRGVFVDTQMNGHGQQLGSVYSVRPRPQAAVATPLRWHELTPRLDPSAFGMRAALERVDRFGDVAAPLLRGRQRLDTALTQLDPG
jgi:bifunctional non-homologous end joining protein LigD